MKIFGKDQFIEMPWKNGGGITTELLRIPKESENFTLRLSLARVSTDGPFSHFPGIDRLLLILQGEGVKLNGETTLTTSSPAYQFPGEKDIECHLINGEVKDFNVMVRRGFASASAEKMNDPELKCEDKLLYVYNVNEEKLYELTKGERLKQKGECIVVKLKK